MDGRVLLGMGPDEVYFSSGLTPKRMNRSKSARGELLQVVFDDGKVYAYFENGALVKWDQQN
jgi:hypothetical protein